MVIAALAMTLGGCAGGYDSSTGRLVPFERSDTLEARLGAKGGSAAKGTVRFAQAANGLGVTISFFDVPGGSYRMVVHANGNCSSASGSSAGPPWVPSGAAGPIVIEFYVPTDNPTSVSQMLPGVALRGPDGVAGHSVVIHEGAIGTLEAQPDRPSNRVACGVIGAVLTVF